MTVKTIGSDEARLKLRDILDDVYAGQHEVVIERYHKPTAVVVGYEQWQAIKRRHLAMLDEQSHKIDAGEFFTQEQVEAGLQERGLI